MNHPVCRVFEIVLTAARPQVSVRVPVGLQISIDCRAGRETPDIELPIFVEERLLDVLLDDVAAPMSVNHVSLDETLDMIEVAAHLDTTASICILSWLHNPK